MDVAHVLVFADGVEGVLRSPCALDLTLEPFAVDVVGRGSAPRPGHRIPSGYLDGARLEPIVDNGDLRRRNCFFGGQIFRRCCPTLARARDMPGAIVGRNIFLMGSKV